MFASMRRYRLERGSMADLARRIDEDFAERLAAQPGFVSYEVIDCGLGQFMTLSVFLTLQQAEASRELARRWADENRHMLEFASIEAAHGEIVVGRVAEGMLEATHVGGARKFAAVRRYRLHAGTVGELFHRIDAGFADRLEAMKGFAAWHVFDCGGQEILWLSFVRDLAAAEECDEQTTQFVREELRDFALEPKVALSGPLLVSRGRGELLEAARA
jgi:hypothetical protein